MECLSFVVIIACSRPFNVRKLRAALSILLVSCCAMTITRAFFPASRCKGEAGQAVLRGRRLQLHVAAAQPGGRHVVRGRARGAVRPQPVGHQQDQTAEERTSDTS